jgi:hypothetical protein
MAAALREVVTLSNTVEYQVGSIMEWSRFDPSIPDNTTIYPQLEDEHAILRRDFSSSTAIMNCTIDYWIAYAVRLTVPASQIAIFVSVFNALPSTRTFWTDQTKFTTASHIDEAREMIHAHFQQGKA